MKRALVIIPTYNEIENINDIIPAVLSQDDMLTILVVDDNSPDGTAEQVEELQKEYGDRLHLLKRSGKLGLGTAYLEGFRYGLKHGFDYMIEMDADFSHNPKDVMRLIERCRDTDADIAVGSRYTKGGGIKDWPMDRLILSYGASLYVRMISWLPVKDPTAGFICYSRKVLDTLNLDKISLIGYGFQIEMKYASRINGFKISEVPIIFKDREKGVSKLDSSIIYEAIGGVIKLRWRGLKGYYKV